MVAVTDESLKTQVLARLRQDDRVKTHNVGVTVSNGIVTLMGNVPTDQTKQAAEDNAWQVQGVAMVRNQLDVQYSLAAQSLSDDTIAANAEKALTLNASIDETKIDADVSDGIVVLRGTVDTYWKKFEAERQVYSQLGVLDVVNELGVVPTESIDDEVLAMDIEDALEQNVGLNVEDVTVIVENGKITLTGVVPSIAMQQAIVDVVSYTSGVLEIIDSLTVSSL